jgi:hypothetical protein
MYAVQLKDRIMCIYDLCNVLKKIFVERIIFCGKYVSLIVSLPPLPPKKSYPAVAITIVIWNGNW